MQNKIWENIENMEQQLNWLLEDFFELNQDEIKIKEDNEKLAKYPWLLKYKNILKWSFITFKRVKELISIKQDLSKEDKQIFFDIYDELFKQKYYIAFVREYLRFMVWDKKWDIYKILDEILQKKEKYKGFLTYAYVLANYENHQINFQEIFSNLNDLSYRAKLDREFYTKYDVFSEKNLSFFQERLTEDIKNLLLYIEKEFDKDEKKLNKLTEDIKNFNIENIEEYINYVKKYSILKTLFDRLFWKFDDAEIWWKILILWNKVWKILTNLWYKSLKIKISSDILANQNKLNQTNNLEEKQQILAKISVYQNILDLLKQTEEEIKNTDKILWNNFEQYLLFIKWSKITEKLNSLVSMLQKNLKEVLEEVKFDSYKEYNIQKEKEILLKNIEKNLNNNLLQAYIDIANYQKKYWKDIRLSSILKYLDEEYIFLNYINQLITKLDNLENILDDIETIKKLKEIIKEKEDKKYIKYVVNKLYNFFVKWEWEITSPIVRLDTHNTSEIEKIINEDSIAHRKLGIEGWTDKAILRVRGRIDKNIYDILSWKVKYLWYLLKLSEQWYVSKYKNLLEQMKIIIEWGYNILELLKIEKDLETEHEKILYNKFINKHKENIDKEIAYLLESYLNATEQNKIIYLSKIQDFNLNCKKYLDILGKKYKDLLLDLLKWKLTYEDLEKKLEEIIPNTEERLEENRNILELFEIIWYKQYKYSKMKRMYDNKLYIVKKFLTERKIEKLNEKEAVVIKEYSEFIWLTEKEEEQLIEKLPIIWLEEEEKIYNPKKEMISWYAKSPSWKYEAIILNNSNILIHWEWIEDTILESKTTSMSNRIYKIQFNPKNENEIIYVNSTCKEIILYNIKTKEINKLCEIEEVIYSLYTDWDYIVIGVRHLDMGKVIMYNIKTGEKKELYRHNGTSVYSVYKYWDYIFSGWTDSKVIMYNIKTGEKKELYSHSDDYCEVRFIYVNWDYVISGCNIVNRGDSMIIYNIKTEKKYINNEIYATHYMDWKVAAFVGLINSYKYKVIWRKDIIK